MTDMDDLIERDHMEVDIDYLWNDADKILADEENLIIEKKEPEEESSKSSNKSKKLRPFEQYIQDVCSGKLPLFLKL